MKIIYDKIDIRQFMLYYTLNVIKIQSKLRGRQKNGK